MQLDIIRTADEFGSLAAEWNTLLSEGASRVPFLRHEYLMTWWSTRGGGEWDQAELCIVAARDENGELCGVAPLFRTQNLDGKPALMLLGSIEISDYLDLLVRPEQIGGFLPALLERLQESDIPEWELLDWYNILEDSPTLPALQKAAESQGLQYAHEQISHCPYVPLPGDWEEYLAGIDSKQRHEIRRKIRRAEERTEDPVRWYIVEDESTLEEEIESFLKLMGQDDQKKDFLTDVMRTQMRGAVRAAFRENWLQLAFLEVGGVKAAGYLNFDYANHIWVYNSGMDFDYGSLSPGWVLLGYLLQWANENGREVFDFMRGDERYKYKFGGVDRFVVRVQVRR
jgi:CelD/BcsL family acetyltransferase involved in cellulose biosynthesis